MSKETQALLALLVHLELLESRGKMARMENPASRALVETVDHKVFAVWLVLQAHKVSKERKVLKVEQGHVVNKESKDQKGTPETEAQKDHVEVAPLAHKDLKESRVLRVREELLDLVPVAQPAQWVHEENAERWANKAKRAILALLAHRALVVAMV